MGWRFCSQTYYPVLMNALRLNIFEKFMVNIFSYEIFPTFESLIRKHLVMEPTKSELEILQVLWQHGPSTVRFVNDRLNEEKRAVQYSSTLKLMQIMAEKGIVKRDESSMKHVYSPAEAEDKTKSLLLERFVDSTYKGSAASLVMQLFGNKNTSKEELDEIKEFLKKLDS